MLIKIVFAILMLVIGVRGGSCKYQMVNDNSEWAIGVFLYEDINLELWIQQYFLMRTYEILWFGYNEYFYLICFQKLMFLHCLTMHHA